MNLTPWRRVQRPGQPQVQLATYSRTGKLHRRTVTLYPPAPVPSNCLDLSSPFQVLDRDMGLYLAYLDREVARRRAELAVEDVPLFLAPRTVAEGAA